MTLGRLRTKITVILSIVVVLAIGLTALAFMLSGVKFNPQTFIFLVLAMILAGLALAAAVLFIYSDIHNRVVKISQSLELDNMLDDKSIETTGMVVGGDIERLLNQKLNLLKAVFLELKIQRDVLRSMISHLSDGIIVVEPDKKVSMINTAACNMFGCDETSALGRTLIAVVMDYEIENLMGLCRSSGQQQSALIKAGHGRQILRAVVSPMPGAHSFLLLLQDLTAIKQSEMEMQDFISNISHELRTPISAIKALAETLKEGALNDKKVARDFLEKIDTEADKLSLMLREVGDLSKIESGSMAHKKLLFNIEDMLWNVISRLEQQASRAGVKLGVDIQEDLPWIKADKEKIEQVLINLIHNAIKFTPEKGSITVSAHQDKDDILFSVADTGIGIPAEEQPRIFERFYKVDKARTGGGTGLGLAIAKQLVESHNGRIWVESSEGRGSTFYFTVPVG